MIDAHLLRPETGEPRIFRDLVIDKSYSLLAGYLYRRLTLLPVVKPRLRPAAVTLRVEIDGSDTLHIETLHVYLETGQRICQIAVGCCLVRKFFFTSSPHEERYMPWRSAM